MADTPLCKDHDFESCDENDYSLEEHIPSDDEGNVIVRERRDSEDKNDNTVKDDDDLYDDYWTDTASEGEEEDDNMNERKDNKNKETDELKDDKVDDAENEINDDDEGPEVQAYGHRGSHNRNRSRGRSSRGHSRGHGHHSTRGGSHRRRNGHQKHGLTLSRVFMPTMRTVSISVPDDLKNWKCGRPTKLITLNPHGKTGRREFKLISKVVESTKRNHTSGHFKHYHFVKIQKVVNGCFWKRYRRRQEEIHGEAHFVNERMLFHGTNKIQELLANGFDERYANINGMFGAGIYFAKHSSKSNQYAFGLNNPCPRHRDINCDKCERHMLLCRVTMGKVKKATGATKIAHAPPGHHSVEGVVSNRPGGLKFPEYIVYRGEQVYAEYLITYKIVK